jgi:uncharacterized membrane protein YccC
MASTQTMKEVFDLDLEALDFRGAVTGLVSLVGVVALIGVLGPAAMAAGIAALFVIAGDSDDTRGPDSVQVGLVLVGALITLVVGWSANSAVAATITLTLVTLGVTLLSMRGPRPAAAGTYALLWATLTLSIGATDESAAAMTIAFLAGGLLALGVLWLAERVPDPEESTGEDAGEVPDTAADDGKSEPRPWAIETFAIVRAVTAGACVALGYWLFPDHSAWAVLTFVLVLQPPKQQAVLVGVQRTLGTAAGVVVGMLIAQLVGDQTTVIAIAFAISGFLMLATKNVNYALSTTFTTTLLLLAGRLLQGDVFSTGWQRLLATLLGVVAAFTVIVAMNLVTRQRASAAAGGGEAA